MIKELIAVISLRTDKPFISVVAESIAPFMPERKLGNVVATVVAAIVTMGSCNLRNSAVLAARSSCKKGKTADTTAKENPAEPGHKKIGCIK